MSSTWIVKLVLPIQYFFFGNASSQGVLTYPVNLKMEPTNTSYSYHRRANWSPIFIHFKMFNRTLNMTSLECHNHSRTQDSQFQIAKFHRVFGLQENEPLKWLFKYTHTIKGFAIKWRLLISSGGKHPPPTLLTVNLNPSIPKIFFFKSK